MRHCRSREVSSEVRSAARSRGVETLERGGNLVEGVGTLERGGIFGRGGEDPRARWRWVRERVPLKERLERLLGLNRL